MFSGRRSDYARLYRRMHPLAIWFSLGISFIGFVTLVFPSAAEQSSTTAAIPSDVLKLFNLAYFAGGAIALLGLLRVVHRLEAAGMAILSSVLFIQWASILVVRPSAWLTATFVLALAIGCGRRCWILAQGDF